MATWSRRRKFIGALTLIVIVAILVGLPTFFLFYEEPSCFDGKLNGDEQGMDCGGSCTKLCSSSFIPLPSPSWVRYKEISPRLFNVAAYIVNPNPTGTARNLSYVFEFLDSKGLKITDVSGTLTVPTGRNTLAFQGAVSSGIHDPARVIFKWKGEPDWEVSQDKLAQVEVINKDYREALDGSSLEVSLRNRGAIASRNVIVYAILKDKSDTVLDFSKTVLDEIPPAKDVIAPFTWPFNHNGEVISIEVLLVAE